VVIHKVEDLRVCGPSQVWEILSGNEKGWGDAFVMVGALEMAIELLVEGPIIPSNPEGWNQPIGY